MSTETKTMNSITPAVPMKKKPKKDPKTCPVHVVVRIRPLCEREKAEQVTSILSTQNEKELTVTYKERGRGQGNTSKIYSFDSVFNHHVSQAHLYDHHNFEIWSTRFLSFSKPSV